MFFSNLQYPKSFQREKKNCAIFISSYQNTFIESVLRLLAFTSTFSLMAQIIDVQKIKSGTFKQVIKLLKIMRSGQFRILRISEFEQVFFSEYPEFLSYDNHNPIRMLFIIFKLIQNELGWRDTYCSPKQNLQSERLEWDISKTQYKYSPLKEMLLSRSSVVQICLNCKVQKDKSLSMNYFQCLSLQPKGYGASFIKRKSMELNIIKAIQSSFKTKDIEQSELTFFCEECSLNTEHQIKTMIEPGNYILFNIESSDNSKLIIPKEFDLQHLSKAKFILNQDSLIFQFVAGIYKENQEKLTYNSQYGTVVDHVKNKKFICFSQRNITQYEALNFEKSFSVLIYKRKSNENIFPIRKNIKSTLYLIEEQQLQVQNPIFLPDFYTVYLSEHCRAPPLINPFICHHGLRNVSIQQMSKCEKINYLPVEIYNFLVQQFGGRKINKNTQKSFNNECDICLKGLQDLHQIKTIQKQAMKYADNFSIKKGQVLIYKPWLQKWKSYLYEKSKQNYTFWGNSPPLEINNYLGMKQKNPKLIDQCQYSKISIEVWMTLIAFHRGGPQLTVKKSAKNNNVKNYLNLRVEEAKKLYDQLGKSLSPSIKQLLQIDVDKTDQGQNTKVQPQGEMVEQGQDQDAYEKLPVGSFQSSRQNSRPKLVLNSRQKSLKRNRK